jgi:hypothetical protein
MKKYRLVKTWWRDYEYKIQRRFFLFGWITIKRLDTNRFEAEKLFDRYIKTGNLDEKIL